MGHDDRPDEARGDAPTGRIGKLHLAIPVLELYLEGFCEVLAEVVARAGLQSLFIAHHRFAGVGVVGSGETLSLRLLSLKDGQREIVCHDAAVHLEHTQRLLDGLILARVGGVPLLPEEFRGTQEEARALLPAHDVAPLVYEDRQISPRLDPFAVHVADDGLRCRAHDERFLKLFAAGMGDYGAFRRKALYMLRLFGEEGLRDEQRKGGVDVPRLFEGVVKMLLNELPDRVARRAHDHASAHRRVVRHLRGADDVEIPLRIIFFFRCDVFCHL
ncbi:hypothetical protein SDC9_144417 [bioreactor metagenome]|uniref:Uncharacterized protein n=1 Tax=bioreactor metagenome TaxID=1076179 RepID=A0A645E617_9ZZZZ